MTHQFITWLKAQQFDKPMVEAVGKIFHACFESANADHYVSKTYNELLEDVNSIIKNKWDDLLGVFTRTGEFVFQCNDTTPIITLYISPLSDESRHQSERSSIELLVTENRNVFKELHNDLMHESVPPYMSNLVRDKLIEIIQRNPLTVRTIKQRILNIYNKIYPVDTNELLDNDWKGWERRWNINDVLSSMDPDFENMTFKDFVKKVLPHHFNEHDDLSNIKQFIETVNYYGMNIDIDQRYLKALIDKVYSEEMSVQQAISYLSGTYMVGRYLGSSNCVQLSNGCIWRAGKIYNRDKVLYMLKKMYDSYQYEETVETMSDKEYKMQSLMHELKGNRTPLPRERVVKKARSENELPFKEWATTVDDTGKTPLDAVLDSLADEVDTVSSNQDNDERMSRIAQSSLYPAVESVN